MIFHINFEYAILGSPFGHAYKNIQQACTPVDRSLRRHDGNDRG